MFIISSFSGSPSRLKTWLFQNLKTNVSGNYSPVKKAFEETFVKRKKNYRFNFGKTGLVE